MSTSLGDTSQTTQILEFISSGYGDESRISDLQTLDITHSLTHGVVGVVSASHVYFKNGCVSFVTSTKSVSVSLTKELRI